MIIVFICFFASLLVKNWRAFQIYLNSNSNNEHSVDISSSIILPVCKYTIYSNYFLASDLLRCCHVRFRVSSHFPHFLSLSTFPPKIIISRQIFVLPATKLFCPAKYALFPPIQILSRQNKFSPLNIIGFRTVWNSTDILSFPDHCKYCRCQGQYVLTTIPPIATHNIIRV